MICRKCENEIVKEGTIPYFCSDCKPILSNKCPSCDDMMVRESYSCDKCWNDTKEDRKYMTSIMFPEFFRLRGLIRKRERESTVFPSSTTSEGYTNG